MRKKVQNQSSGDTKFFAEEKEFGKLPKPLTFTDEDQFVHTPAFKDRPDFGQLEDADQLEAPRLMILKRSCKIVSGRTFPGDGDVSHIECTVFGNSQQNESIRNKKNV